MKNGKIFFLIFLFALPFNLAGQIKYEREYNLKKAKLPELALSFIDSCCPYTKVKWYGEESLTGKSIEAKIIYKGLHYSIEFDTSGHIQDVEKKTRIDDIPQTVRLTIVNKLDSVFSGYKIEKIQVQWTGLNQALFQLIKENNSTLPHVINYEIVVNGRKDKSAKMYEVLCNSNGSISSVSEIVQRNTDNLDY